ncbi:MAG TPA: ThuA domain-containing protein [Longimicrobiales bacterium]|nr:ThuA domain-containing protein [Longimicrobiales bacterium]
MWKRIPGLALPLVILFMPVAANAQQAAGGDADRQLLIFSRTAGFRHGSINVAVPAITALAEKKGVAVHATEDPAFFTDENLARFDAVIFVSTTGQFLEEAQRAAFERYIRNGGGYVGIHAASDVPAGWWPWYEGLVGATFRNHPRNQDAAVIVVDPEHVSTAMLEPRWTRYDEWYNFRALPEGVNVLLRLDTDSYEGSGHPGNHPIAWYREYDGGRAFYTGLGHTNESFTEDEAFLAHLWGGISYAAGFAAE